jgi:hypothetical protein
MPREEQLMIVVRQVFHARFGRAGELAIELRNTYDALTRALGIGSGWRGLTGRGLRILSDISGPVDTVVVEIELDSLAEWERIRREVFGSPMFRDSLPRAMALVESGRTELYTVEAIT